MDKEDYEGIPDYVVLDNLYANNEPAVYKFDKSECFEKISQQAGSGWSKIS